MTKYQKHLTKTRNSTFDRVPPWRSKIWPRLRLKDDSEDLILNPQNNLVNHRLLKNNSIYHNNKHKNFYQIGLKKVLAQAKHWRNSFLLKSLNCSDGAMHLLRVDVDPIGFPMLSKYQRHYSFYLFLPGTNVCST